MDDPNITMEEYIRLEEEKARRHGKVYNWETATYGKIRVDDDLHDLSSLKGEFPTIVFNDAFAPQDTFQYKSQVNMALPPCEQIHRFLRYEGLEYTDTDIVDFEGRLARIHMREVHRVPVFDFGGLPDLMAEGLTARMTMEHRDEAGVSVFTSRAWMRMFDIRGPLVHELILEFFSTFRFGQAILDLDTLGTLQFQLAPSYTVIMDPILRMYHRLIACSIAGRSQAPEKVTVTDLFYLRGIDVGSVNVSYLLARYLRLFAAGRKSGAHISVIDMEELVRLQISVELDDTWAWVAMGPERQPDAAAGALADAEDALIVNKGGQANQALVQAP
ncbi:hypothetical protein Tco_1515359 [Tanacetum coccineum]